MDFFMVFLNISLTANNIVQYQFVSELSDLI